MVAKGCVLENMGWLWMDIRIMQERYPVSVNSELPPESWDILGMIKLSLQKLTWTVRNGIFISCFGWAIYRRFYYNKEGVCFGKYGLTHDGIRIMHVRYSVSVNSELTSGLKHTSGMIKLSLQELTWTVRNGIVTPCFDWTIYKRFCYGRNRVCFRKYAWEISCIG